MRIVVAVVSLFTAVFAHGATFDIVIRNGRVLDGSGNPWYYADIWIRDGRIEAMGRVNINGVAEADIVIDASGLYVAPGFIDVHSHAATGLARHDLKSATPILAQGVTTVVLNPDGGGPWPLSAQRATYESNGIGVNVALMVGHGTVRREVMGVEDRPPTDDELARMKSMVREGMAAGAFGLTSGPYYAPGSYASTAEVIALAKEVQPVGVYASHIRDESDYTVGLLAAIDEVVHIAEEARLPGIVTHMKALGPDSWGKAVAACVRIERARARGVPIWADQYPYEASGISITGALVPRWALAGETMPGQPSPLARRLRNPRERARLREEMLVNLTRRGGSKTLQISRYAPEPSLEGRMLADIARARKTEAIDVVLELLDSGGAGLISFSLSEDDIRHIMRQNFTMTSSDGGLVAIGEGKPHPRFYGAFARKIARYVRDRGVISLPHAIRSMTSLPAMVFGIAERGQLRRGAWADIVVFDLEKFRDRATYQNPHQLAEGVAHVLVNGQLSWGKLSGAGVLAGRVLRPEE